jgi:hypothetical protein
MHDDDKKLPEIETIRPNATRQIAGSFSRLNSECGSSFMKIKPGKMYDSGIAVNSPCKSRERGRQKEFVTTSRNNRRLTFSSSIGPRHSLVGDTKNAENTTNSVIIKLFCVIYRKLVSNVKKKIHFPHPIDIVPFLLRIYIFIILDKFVGVKSFYLSSYNL